MSDPSDINALPSLRVLLVSMGVCLFVGVPVGVGALDVMKYGAFIPDAQGLQTFIFSLIFGFLVGAPIALIAGMIAGLVLLQLLQSEQWHPGWLGWTFGCMALGMLIAAALAVAIWYSARWEEPFPILIGFLVVTGASCGASLGFYGWYEAQTRESSRVRA